MEMVHKMIMFMKALGFPLLLAFLGTSNRIKIMKKRLKKWDALPLGDNFPYINQRQKFSRMEFLI